jgi:serine/threonine protein phosphatase 1
MFRFSREQEETPAGPRGYRAYVVGDVHGRLDLLTGLLDKIHAEIDRKPPRRALLVFLGDLIDRGPQSAEVVERLRTYRRHGVRPMFILGNHEEVLLRILDGDSSLIASWLNFGGSECLQSYGVDPRVIESKPKDEALAMVRKAIPAAHVEFLRGFADTCRFGDYLFVHAGIRPGVELASQRQSDLRWIREPFLVDESDHGFVVVHGHSISGKIDEQPNRIGIDTGAFATGILTALAIEGGQRWYLDTRAAAETAVSSAH